MTANLCFKIGKYLNTNSYKMGIISIMESVPDIEIVNLTILFTDNYGLKKDGLTVAEGIAFILHTCEQTDTMPDDAKNFIREHYLEAYPEDKA